jgi:hypothetical protein
VLKTLKIPHTVAQLYGLPHGILHVFNTILYENEFQNPPTDHQSFSRAIYFSSKLVYAYGLASKDWIGVFSLVFKQFPICLVGSIYTFHFEKGGRAFLGLRQQQFGLLLACRRQGKFKEPLHPSHTRSLLSRADPESPTEMTDGQPITIYR